MYLPTEIMVVHPQLPIFNILSGFNDILINWTPITYATDELPFLCYVSFLYQ